MLNESAFFENGVTLQNLALLTDGLALQAEKRICELRELAESLADAALIFFREGYGIYEVLGIVDDGLQFDTKAESYSPLAENVGSVNSYLFALSAEDKALFSKYFADSLRLRKVPVKESEFLKEEKNEETFIYVKNLLADEAYDVFSQEFSDPRISYAHSFREAVDAVSSGTVAHCILPLEERGGARISGIASMLFSEELKINSVTPVFGIDGSADMKYALVSRNFYIPEFDPDDDRYLEIRLSAQSSDVLRELLIAAEAHGVEVYRVNTVVFDTDDGSEPYFNVVLKKNKEDFSDFLVFLTLFCPSYTAIGIYKNLE